MWTLSAAGRGSRSLAKGEMWHKYAQDSGATTPRHSHSHPVDDGDTGERKSAFRTSLASRANCPTLKLRTNGSSISTTTDRQPYTGIPS
jgi:hypothetical protein